MVFLPWGFTWGGDRAAREAEPGTRAGQRPLGHQHAEQRERALGGAARLGLVDHENLRPGEPLMSSFSQPSSTRPICG